MKFSCPSCGQHISADEAWGGHQIECPACHNSLVVPQVHTAPTPAPAPVPPEENPKAAGAKLAAGVTQVARSTAHAPAPIKRNIPRPPRGDNALLKYGVLAAVVVVLGGVGYFYGLPLITGALKGSDVGAPISGGAVGGPMGSVNEAMDASETLDGGSSSSPRRRPPAATNNAARPKPAAPPK
jgi:hypothetical protein